MSPRPSEPTSAAEASSRAATLAHALLEQHVAHELTQWQGPALQQQLATETQEALAALSRFRLKDLSSVDSVMETIERTVIDARIGGGITDLAGDLVLKVFQSPEHTQARLKDIIAQRQFEGFLDQILSMHEQRRKLVHRILQHPLYSELIARVLYEAMTRYLLKDNQLTGLLNQRFSGVLQFGKRMVDKAAPDLDAGLKASVTGFIRRNIRFFVRESERFLNRSLSDDSLRDAVMDVWDQVENQTLGSLQQDIDALSINDFVALGYEFWLHYRKTPHFSAACRTVVTGLFEKYGDTGMGELLEELGISAAMIQTEVQAQLPIWIERLRESGYLEEAIRRRLERFYFSSATLEILSGCSVKGDLRT